MLFWLFLARLLSTDDLKLFLATDTELKEKLPHSPLHVSASAPWITASIANAVVEFTS